MHDGVLGDIYMQNPRGNNDRLNENGDRNNANRLFDSQNNARGGYCWGPELSYYEGPSLPLSSSSLHPFLPSPVAYPTLPLSLNVCLGSILSIEWTNQHSCGNDNTKCQLIIQYMCSDDSEGADETKVCIMISIVVIFVYYLCLPSLMGDNRISYFIQCYFPVLSCAIFVMLHVLSVVL